MSEIQREEMLYDVVIVGAGPAGLSSAIKLKQLNEELSICILEKASEVGAHILSGNVFETKAMDELIPNWRELDTPINTKVVSEDFSFFSQKIPACFFRLGVRNEDLGIVHGLHHPKFDIDKNALKFGAGLMAYITLNAFD